MNLEKLSLEGAWLIKTNSREDIRGKFTRLFCQEALVDIHQRQSLDQINLSFTKLKGTLRGLHYQEEPYAEIKIIKCLRGVIYDVIVDIRKNSPTFLKWEAKILKKDDDKLLYVPKGFAHGFQSLSDETELLYLHHSNYEKEYEAGLKYNDPLLNISWPLTITEISDRDQAHPYLDPKFCGVMI